MGNHYTLPYTAEEIEQRLQKAGEAVAVTAQTLTPAQQAQARENIGAGMALIDLDTYGAQPINLILGSLFQQGGGKVENADLGNLMEDICTDKTLCMKFTFGENVLHTYGVTTVRYKNKCVQLCTNIMITHQTTTYVAYLTIFSPNIANPSNGHISLMAAALA